VVTNFLVFRKGERDLTRQKSVLYLSGLFILPLVLAVFMVAQANVATPVAAAGTAGGQVQPIKIVQTTAIGSTPRVDIPTMAEPTAVPEAARPSSRARGTSAIKVTNAKAANANGAKFSEADVRQFLKDYPSWGQIRSLTPFTVEKVEFLKASEVKTRTKQDVAKLVGVPDTTMFCLVTALGNFSVAAGPPVPGQDPTAHQGLTFTHAYQLFDAETGNLVMMGGLGN
jgi:hypothetical protein